ncbi:MAG TPA: hypothetical protein VMI53_13865 [Opitutaceae bacterium]|nr:hypothetical protein [Opitutaceae bacterium]
MLYFVELMGVLLAGAWIVLIAALMRAPEGYEDEQGFHQGHQVQAEDDGFEADDFGLLREYVTRCDAQHVVEAEIERESAGFDRTSLGFRQ